MPLYLEEMETAELLQGLDYLAAVEIGPETLPPCEVLIVHGEQDAVAPLPEARSLAEGAGDAQLHVLPHAGHAAFLTKDFERLMKDA